jgi:hypothetical protein
MSLHRQKHSALAIADMVAQFPRATVSFGFGGKHRFAEITVGDRRRKLFFATTPSCRHAYKNACRDARRILTELTGAAL